MNNPPYESPKQNTRVPASLISLGKKTLVEAKTEDELEIKTEGRSCFKLIFFLQSRILFLQPRKLVCFVMTRSGPLI